MLTLRQRDLFDAVANFDLQKVEDYFLAEDVNALDTNGKTLLNFTVYNTAIANVMTPLVHQKRSSDGKLDPFIHPRISYFLIIDFLIKQGADVNLKDENGHTPLQIAIDHSYGEVKLMEYLIDKGADMFVEMERLGLDETALIDDGEQEDFLVAKGAETSKDSGKGGPSQQGFTFLNEGSEPVKEPSHPSSSTPTLTRTHGPGA